MIEPTATDVLCSIEACFETVIRPALAGPAERSAAATMSHLLRHLRLRLDGERGIEAEDALRQAPLLARLEEYFVATGQGAGGATDEVGPYSRQQELEASLLRLVKLRATQGRTPAYQALRAELRVEIAAQLQSEAALIHPAFAGHGPRR